MRRWKINSQDWHGHYETEIPDHAIAIETLENEIAESQKLQEIYMLGVSQNQDHLKKIENSTEKDYIARVTQSRDDYQSRVDALKPIIANLQKTLAYLKKETSNA